MSDEEALKVWLDASEAAMGPACGIPDCEECHAAARVIAAALKEREQRIVEWLRAQASDMLPEELHEADPLITASAFAHGFATKIEAGEHLRGGE